MIKQGTKPTVKSHKDYSHRSFGAIQVPFPTEYNTDAGLLIPNQNAEGLPYGCTDEAQSEVSNDLVQMQSYTPFQLESVTHANALGGYDIRSSLLAIRNLGWISGFFNIEAIGQDMFDAVRDAMVSGGTEKRSVTIGSKWFHEYEFPVNGILPTPDFNGSNYTWHNWKICGWKLINDQIYLIGVSWQGNTYGDKGFHYISRQHFNQLMNIGGSVAFTATKGVLPPITTISLSWLQWLMSYARQLKPF